MQILALLVVSAGASAGCLFQPALPVTRADLAASYLEFEEAFRDYPPAEGDVARVNREFDQASISFFSGQYGRAVEQIDRMSAALRPATASTADRAIATSLKLQFEPPIRASGSPSPIRVSIGSLYPVDAGESRARNWTLRLRPASGESVDTPFAFQSGKMTRIDQELAIEANDARLPVGTYSVQLIADDKREFSVGRFFVTSRPPDDTRSANEARLAAIATDDVALRRAVAICRARNELLSNEPSEVDSAQFLADPLALAESLEAEIRALSEQRNPYANRTGDYWRIVAADSGNIPLRFFAPAVVAAEPHTPRPLVVAFHGAGGDEQMFMDGYGAGIIRTLAEQHGFLLATPASLAFLRDAEPFDRLLESLESDYRIAPERIYVVGHSLGAGVASMLAASRADRVAASCCIAGGMIGASTPRIARSLWYSGALDGVSPSARLEQSAARATSRGLPLEFRKLDTYGHTLIVGKVMPEAIRWLLDQSRSAAPAEKEKDAKKPPGVQR